MNESETSKQLKEKGFCEHGKNPTTCHACKRPEKEQTASETMNKRHNMGEKLEELKSKPESRIPFGSKIRELRIRKQEKAIREENLRTGHEKENPWD